MTGLGQSHGLGASNSTTQPQQQSSAAAADEQKNSVSSSGSDILDTSSHELRLEKSNILMLGPTGSGIPLLSMLKKDKKQRSLSANFVYRKNAFGTDYCSMFRCPICNL